MQSSLNHHYIDIICQLQDPFLCFVGAVDTVHIDSFNNLSETIEVVHMSLDCFEFSMSGSFEISRVILFQPCLL